MAEQKNIISERYAQEISDILLQYAPEGWMQIYLKFYSDIELSRINTWAETTRNKNYGFKLDEHDADVIESIFLKILDGFETQYNNIEFQLSSDGTFQSTISKIGG